jgi:hypothetical protein
MRFSNRFAPLLFAVSVSGTGLIPAAVAAPAGDACALITPAQVGAALGVSVGAGSYVTPTYKRTCTWTATTSGGGYVTLLLQDVSGFEGGKRLALVGAKNMSLTSISGVGDDAYYLAVGDQVGLIVKKGNAAFKVAVYAHIALDSKEAKEKTLALNVLAGL